MGPSSMEALESRLLAPGAGPGAANYMAANFEQFLQEGEAAEAMARWREAVEQHAGGAAGLETGLAVLLAASDPAAVTTIHRVGVAALQLFVSVNWLGKELAPPPAVLLPVLTAVPDTAQLLERVLVRDGECLVPAVRHPLLLAVASIILVDCGDSFSHLWTQHFWVLRCCSVLADALEERSDLLHRRTAAVLEAGLAADWAGEAAGLEPLYLLEAAAHHSRYYRVQEADGLVERAAGLVGLTLAETGALGRRTRFQDRDIAQFTLQLGVGAAGELEEMDRSGLARDVRLEDDLRLDRIQFREARDDPTGRLDGLQQAVLMAAFASKQRRLPTVDALTAEELLPYLRPLTDWPRCWPLHTAALLARSLIESGAGRTVERALAQVESLLESLRAEWRPSRLQLVHASHLPPSWELEHKLGQMLVGLGQVKAALDIYLRLEQWEEVIACYTHLALRHKAAEVINARLAERETPRLWCLLGDATDDLACYRKALELSQDRSARAWRSIGFHYYAHKDFAACVSYFEKSLERSSFQPKTQLRLAYAAMELEDWERAARAYRSYCTMEDSFEAWNNLARCYVKLDQKERAWRVLHEAVRCDFENWKVWDNRMVIAVDIGMFEDSIYSYNRVLDIKKTHVDAEVLRVLAGAVAADTEDFHGAGAGQLRAEVQKLLARLTVAQPREPAPWLHYGALLAGEGAGQEGLVRAAQCYQRCLAATTGRSGWEKSRASCSEVLGAGLAWLELLHRLEGPQELQLANSARLSLAGALKVVEKGQAEASTGLLPEEVEAEVRPVRQALARLVERIAEIKA